MNLEVLRPFAAAAVCAGLAATPLKADTVGLPFLTIDGASGSILDYFMFNIPSGVTQVALNGTVSEGQSAPLTVGKAFSFNTSVNPGGVTAEMTLGATTLSGFNIFPTNSSGVSDYDPFQDGPGDLNFRMAIFPPLTGDVDNGDGTYTFSYGGDFADWSGRVSTVPEFEVMLSLYLSGPLPLKTFQEFDEDGNFVGDIDYVEGPLSIAYMTLGTIDGPPLVNPVPVPASLPLLLGGIAGLAALRRRRRAKG